MQKQSARAIGIYRKQKLQTSIYPLCTVEGKMGKMIAIVVVMCDDEIEYAL